MNSAVCHPVSIIQILNSILVHFPLENFFFYCKLYVYLK